jgi:hypothetical protein
VNKRQKSMLLTTGLGIYCLLAMLFLITSVGADLTRTKDQYSELAGFIGFAMLILPTTIVWIKSFVKAGKKK